MLKSKWILPLLAFSLSFSAMAQDQVEVKTMGLLIKNRKTSEILGLRCENMDKDQMCTKFQFLLLSKVKKDEMQILAKVGDPLHYNQLSGILDSIRTDVYHAYRNESFINDSGISLSDSDLNDVYLENHLTGISTFLIAGDNSWSTGGKIWRRVVGAVTLPIFLMADGARYASEALIATGEIVGKTVVYGTVGLVYDLPDSVRAGSKAGKAEASLRKVNQKRYSKSVKKVSNRLFNIIKSKIINY
jgi:hypothetical protein